MKTGLKFIGIIWSSILGFFVMMFIAFILQKTSIWFNIPFLMEQKYTFFIALLVIVSLLFLDTQGWQIINKELKKSFDDKEDKDDYEIGWLFTKPFVKGFMFLLAFAIVYIYYLILM